MKKIVLLFFVLLNVIGYAQLGKPVFTKAERDSINDLIDEKLDTAGVGILASAATLDSIVTDYWNGNLGGTPSFDAYWDSTIAREQISIPDIVYFMANVENGIYYDAVFSNELADNIRSVGCYLRGNTYSNRFYWTPPLSDVGDHLAKAELYTPNNLSDKYDYFTIRVVDDTASTPVKLLTIGDSITLMELWQAHVDTLLTNLTFVGMRQGSKNLDCEARGGWDVYHYDTAYVNSPFTPFKHPANYTFYGNTSFWKNVVADSDAYDFFGFQEIRNEIGFSAVTGFLTSPSVNDLMYDSDNSVYKYWNGSAWTTIAKPTFYYDFAKYLSTWNVPTPNIVTIQLGVNGGSIMDRFGVDYYWATYSAFIDSMIASIHNTNLDIKIILFLNDGGGKDEESGYHQALNEYDETRKQKAYNIWRLNKLSIARWDGREDENIFISDMGYGIDRTYSYQRTTFYPFARYGGSETITKTTGTVHYNQYGGYQAGDRIAGILQYTRSLANNRMAADSLKDLYVTRVEADGGTVIDPVSVRLAYTLMLDSSITARVWLAGNYGVKKNANNKVTKLYDITDHENDAYQSDTSKSPTWYADSLNGLPTVRFDGVNDYLEIADDGTNLDFGTGTFYMHNVIRPITLSYATIWGKGDHYSADNIRMNYNSAGRLEIFWGSDAQSYGSTTTIFYPFHNYYIEDGIKSSVPSRVLKYNSLGGENSIVLHGTGSNSTNSRIGSDTGNTHYANIHLSEFLFLTQEKDIRTFLNHKYEIY